MGLLDKFIAKQMAKLPDYRAEVGNRLAGGDRVLAVSVGMNRASSKSLNEITLIDQRSARSRLVGKALAGVTDAVSQARHIDGDDDSVAVASVPDVGDAIVIALSESALSFWSFGPTNTDVPPTPLGSIPRDRVASITQTGRIPGPAGKGYLTARLSFVDGSWVDYSIADETSYPEFWSVATGFGQP